MKQMEGVVRLDDVIQAIRRHFLSSFEGNLLDVLEKDVPDIKSEKLAEMIINSNSDVDRFIANCLVLRIQALETEEQKGAIDILLTRAGTGLIALPEKTDEGKYCDYYEKNEVLDCVFETLKDLFNLREIEMSNGDKSRIFRIIDAHSH